MRLISPWKALYAQKSLTRTHIRTAQDIYQVYKSSMRSRGIHMNLSSSINLLDITNRRGRDPFSCALSEKLWRDIVLVAKRTTSISPLTLIEILSNTHLHHYIEHNPSVFQDFLQTARRIMHQRIKREEMRHLSK